MGEITISQAWAWLLAAAVALNSLARAWEIIKPKGNVKKKLAEQETLITSLTERVKALESVDIKSALREHNAQLSEDEKRLQALENATVITMETMLAIVQHELDGNNVEGLRKTRDKLNSYLTSQLKG